MNNNTVVFVILAMIAVALVGMAIWVCSLEKKIDRFNNLEERFVHIVDVENKMWATQINEINRHLIKRYDENTADIMLIKRLLEPLVGVSLTNDKAETTNGRLEIAREVNTTGPRWMQMINDIRIDVDKKASKSDVAKLQAAFQQMLINEKMREEEVPDERPEEFEQR